MINTNTLLKHVGEELCIPALQGMLRNPIQCMMDIVEDRKALTLSEILEVYQWLELNRQLYFQELSLHIFEPSDPEFESASVWIVGDERMQANLLTLHNEGNVEQWITTIINMVRHLGSVNHTLAQEAFKAVEKNLNLLALDKKITQAKLDKYAEKIK